MKKYKRYLPKLVRLEFPSDVEAELTKLAAYELIEVGTGSNEKYYIFLYIDEKKYIFQYDLTGVTSENIAAFKTGVVEILVGIR